MMTMRAKWLAVPLLLSVASCSGESPARRCTVASEPPFDPDPGCQLLFVGRLPQHLGGLGPSGPADGYLDHVASLPTGLTVRGEFPAMGDATPFDQLAWVSSASALLARPSSANAMFHLAISWVPESMRDDTVAIETLEQALLGGSHDAFLDALGAWLVAADRPLLVGLGYEFNRPSLKLFTSANYAACYRYIVTRLRAAGLTRVAFVWSSANAGFGAANPAPDTWDFATWYPGDAYVDWFGFTMLYPNDPDTVMLTEARLRGKPILLAETAPAGWDLEAHERWDTFAIAGEPVNGEQIWQGWYRPVLDFMAANADVVKGINFIASPWKTDPVFMNLPYFRHTDARIWLDPVVAAEWVRATDRDPFVQPGALRAP